MGVNSEAVQRFLPYTVGGRDLYIKNPQTGQKFTFAELSKAAQNIQQVYQVNPYIAPDRPAIYA